MKNSIDKRNNFDFLRLLFASLVILHHAFPLSGKLANDPTFFWSHEQFSIGTISVGAFFAISGYLILGSLNRSKGFIDYIWKRLIRLYPGLIVMLVITLIILLCIDFNLIRSRSFWTYLPNRLKLFSSQTGVENIFKNNPYPEVINGSLWTLGYEFSCYLIISFLIVFRNNILVQKIIAFGVFVLFYACYQTKVSFHFFSYLSMDPNKFFEFGTYFMSGMMMYYYNKIKTPYYFIFMVILLAATYFHKFGIFFPLISLMVVSFGRNSTKYINNIGSVIGDLSYGIYIYGFLVQQLLMNYFNLSWISLTILGFLLTFCFAFLSWRYIEKSALQLKKVL